MPRNLTSAVADPVSAMANWGVELSQSQMILFGIMAAAIIFLVIMLAVVLRRRRKEENVPDSLPPLKIPEQQAQPPAPPQPPEPVIELEPVKPRMDFKKLIAEEIIHHTKRKAEIQKEVKKLQVEYESIKDDLAKLENIKRGML